MVAGLVSGLTPLGWLLAFAVLLALGAVLGLLLGASVLRYLPALTP